MTKFLIGLLLGLILGAVGASVFLITGGGSDYFVGASPRVRELEASLREADQERQWLRGRLSETTETGNRLESRFISLAARFEALGGVPASEATTSNPVKQKAVRDPEPAAAKPSTPPAAKPTTPPAASATPVPEARSN